MLHVFLALALLPKMVPQVTPPSGVPEVAWMRFALLIAILGNLVVAAMGKAAADSMMQLGKKVCMIAWIGLKT